MYECGDIPFYMDNIIIYDIFEGKNEERLE